MDCLSLTTAGQDTKEKPYQCPQCLTCFARKELYIRHQTIIHRLARDQIPSPRIIEAENAVAAPRQPSQLVDDRPTENTLDAHSVAVKDHHATASHPTEVFNVSHSIPRPADDHQAVPPELNFESALEGLSEPPQGVHLELQRGINSPISTPGASSAILSSFSASQYSEGDDGQRPDPRDRSINDHNGMAIAGAPSRGIQRPETQNTRTLDSLVPSSSLITDQEAFDLSGLSQYEKATDGTGQVSPSSTFPFNRLQMPICHGLLSSHSQHISSSATTPEDNKAMEEIRDKMSRPFQDYSSVCQTLFPR